MSSSLNRNEYKISEFLAWREAKGLNLSPNFQRRPVWKKGAKSYLIDTILRGMPMPPVFLRDLPTDPRTFKAGREVVDGQQRLRTILAFVRPDLLQNFDASIDDFTVLRVHNKDFANMKFSQMPPDAQEQILDYRIATHTFPSSIDDREILQIFARMNSTGYNLTAQELRNAKYFGEFKTLAYELALEQITRWREWHVFTNYNIARMEEVELTSELMIMIVAGISQKSPASINAAYRDYDSALPHSAELARRVRTVFDQIEDSFPSDTMPLFAKRTLFYSLFGAVYHCLYGLKSDLGHVKKAMMLKADIERIISQGRKLAENKTPRQVFDATQRRTSHAASRRLVIEFLLKDTKEL